MKQIHIKLTDEIAESFRAYTLRNDRSASGCMTTRVRRRKIKGNRSLKNQAFGNMEKQLRVAKSRRLGTATLEADCAILSRAFRNSSSLPRLVLRFGGTP